MRITELRWDKMRRANPHDCQVSLRVITDEVRGHAATIGQRDVDMTGVLHHVAIGQDKAVRREDKARTIAMHLRGRARTGCVSVVRLPEPLNVDH